MYPGYYKNACNSSRTFSRKDGRTLVEHSAVQESTSNPNPWVYDVVYFRTLASSITKKLLVLTLGMGTTCNMIPDTQ